MESGLNQTKQPVRGRSRTPVLRKLMRFHQVHRFTMLSTFIFTIQRQKWFMLVILRDIIIRIIMVELWCTVRDGITVPGTGIITIHAR